MATSFAFSPLQQWGAFWRCRGDRHGVHFANVALNMLARQRDPAPPADTILINRRVD
jgi:hypothetical protein